MSKENPEMEMLAAVGGYEREHGADAATALLKKFGVTRAMDVLPKDFARVIAACEPADDDEAPRRRTTRRAARKVTAFETVVRSADTLQEGLNLAARAIHARRPK